MENKVQTFASEIENSINVFCSIHNINVSSLTLIDVLITLAIMCNKSAKLSWGDFQKDFVTRYEAISDNQEEELVPSKYSVLMFDSTVQGEEFFLVLKEINNRMKDYTNEKSNLECLRSALLIVAVKFTDYIKAGLSRIMDLAFKKYYLIFEGPSNENMSIRCDEYISNYVGYLQDVKLTLKSDNLIVDEIKEEILASLDMCGPGPVLDKFFVTRSVATIIAKSMGLDIFEFFLLCYQAYNEENISDTIEEMSEIEYIKLNKQEADSIFIRDALTTIKNVIRPENFLSNITKINVIKALLKASMYIGRDVGESKFRMIDSITTYLSNAPSTTDIFATIDALIVHFSETATKGGVMTSNVDKEDEEIIINSNLFSLNKGSTVLN